MNMYKPWWYTNGYNLRILQNLFIRTPKRSVEEVLILLFIRPAMVELKIPIQSDALYKAYFYIRQSYIPMQYKAGDSPTQYDP